MGWVPGRGGGACGWVWRCEGRLEEGWGGRGGGVVRAGRWRLPACEPPGAQPRKLPPHPHTHPHLTPLVCDAQASFDPPGLTVAVKQDRAVEALLPVGARFVMNVLAEGRDKVRMHAWREAGAW